MSIEPQEPKTVEQVAPTPTETVQGPVPQTTRNGIVMTAIAVCIAFIFYFFLPFEESAKRGLALLVFIALMWFTEAVHITISALMVPFLGVLLFLPDSNPQGVTISTNEALSSFASPIIFLYLGGFALGTALQVQRLDYFIARWIMKLSGSKLLLASLALSGVTAFLSMWISNTATAAMIIPLAVGLLGQIPEEDRRTRAFVMLSIAYSASIGGLGTLVGSPPNLIAAKALNLTFSEWFPIGLPIMVMLLPITLLVLYLVFKPNLKYRIEIEEEEEFVWTGSRIATIILFITTAALWILGGQLKKLGISSPDTVVALGAAVSVVLFGLARWKQIVHATDWGVLLLFGGGIGLSKILEKSGASLVLGETVAETFHGLPILAVVLIVATFIIFLTEFTSNTASTALLVPVFATIGVNLGLEKELLVLVIGVCASCAFMLPVATPPNALVYATGQVRQRDMIKAGLYLNIVSIFLVGGYLYYFLT